MHPHSHIHTLQSSLVIVGTHFSYPLSNLYSSIGFPAQTAFSSECAPGVSSLPHLWPLAWHILFSVGSILIPDEWWKVHRCWSQGCQVEAKCVLLECEGQCSWKPKSPSRQWQWTWKEQKAIGVWCKCLSISNWQYHGSLGRVGMEEWAWFRGSCTPGNFKDHG